LVEIGFPATAPSILRIDNQSAISVAKHPEHHSTDQENWFLLFLDLNGFQCIYSTIDATIDN
jgi:hypothetical protein